MVLFLPYVIWQTIHDWPTLEFIEVATTEKMAAVPALAFITDQIVVMHPFNLPIWLSGLVFFLFLKNGSRFRLLGLVYGAVAAILLLAGTSRSGYLVPTYTWLLAAGGVVIEGVSLVKNYRTQFDQIFRKEGFDGLMSGINKQLASLETQGTKK